MLHGGDYNPEQWLRSPEILEKDIEYFKKAKINEVSLGIFSWAVLEPVEGEFHFEWMEKIIDRLYENGISTILATPTEQDQDGWHRSILRYFVWMPAVTEICMEKDITTVIHLRYTEKRQEL